VNTTKSIWSYQSASCVKARQGKKGGNVLDFVAVIEGCSIRDAALKLSTWFRASSDARKNSPPPKHVEADAHQLVAEKGEGEVTNVVIGQSVENKPLGFALKIDHSPHPYLTARGITPETASHFGVGFFSGRGSMSGRIVIPIQDRQGRVVAYAGRSIDNAEPKYKLPAGFHKNTELFNVWRAVNPILETLVIVEGFFDCMKVYQAGHRCVVALMGCTLSEHRKNCCSTCHFKKSFLRSMVMKWGSGQRTTSPFGSRAAHSFASLRFRTADNPTSFWKTNSKQFLVRYEPRALHVQGFFSRTTSYDFWRSTTQWGKCHGREEPR